MDDRLISIATDIEREAKRRGLDADVLADRIYYVITDRQRDIPMTMRASQ